MADTSILDAIKVGGGTVVGAVVAAFVKNFFTSSGSQEKGFRDALADEVKDLRDEMRALRTEQAAMRLELDGLRVRNSRLFGERETARLKLALIEQRHGEPATVWPPDVV